MWVLGAGVAPIDSKEKTVACLPTEMEEEAEPRCVTALNSQSPITKEAKGREQGNLFGLGVGQDSKTRTENTCIHTLPKAKRREGGGEEHAMIDSYS